MESYIRRRGEIGGSAKKVGLRIKELDRIYENSRGGDRKSNLNNYGLNHKQMAKMMGISVSTLENYKKLTEMIPELEELVDTGIATPTTALAIIFQTPTIILTLYIKSNNMNI